MKKTLLLFTLIAGFTQSIKAQTQSTRSSVPDAVHQFMLINIDPMSVSMGYGGMALFTDETAIYLNPAMLVHSPNRNGFFLTGSKWLPKLVSDMYILRGGGYWQLSEKSVLSSNITLFQNGTFSYVTNTGVSTDFSSKSWGWGVNYTRHLSNKVSMAVGVKYMHENGTNLLPSINVEIPSKNNIAFDLSLAHVDTDAFKKFSFNYGVNIANIGGKVNLYNKQEAFLPTNLKLGIAPSYKLDVKNKIGFTVDANKLLVPTPTGNHYNDSALSGMVASFSDAPGGLSEELKEITWSLGLQYTYNDFLFLRMGKFLESKEKGNRSFTTFGAGVVIKKLVNLDLAFSKNNNDSSIGDQLFLSVGFNFSRKK
ncbi:type IX secretion system outer membrane channel protein PorV [Arcicella sp. DC2W]|uniref:Type IX secretion system outer membrane channel protein PorV n=1 Tax=Arcicella gelida TaxID=2984195 RepID=A0ABU5S2L9_9BACT|nr:type IX secretion system outer membrane channel protein PorV [Arcicella sp. DC2W]MEA5402696.1 type IX secretion system outer membrane channel protein PorV [Arcicella sp. DC2W]